MDSLFVSSLVKSINIYASRRILKRPRKRVETVAGKKVLNVEETNIFIKKKISSKEPFMAGRWGGCENDILACYYMKKNKLISSIPQKKFMYFCNNAGFYPKDISLLHDFVEVMEESAKQIDLAGAWNWLLEDYIIKTFAKQASITALLNLEPWYSDHPWSKALENKKVLVIHPFEESIIRQYNKRELLFNNKDILPKFELKTLKSVQSIAENRPQGIDTWFEALNHMTKQVEAIDFDIAIVGCGAYGFPLAAKIKMMGKQAIHLAGATQLLFGIKGSRWEKGTYYEYFKNVFNEHWIRPMESETPAGIEKVEGACYW